MDTREFEQIVSTPPDMHSQLSGRKSLKIYFPIPTIDEHNTVLFKIGSNNSGKRENSEVPTWADVVESVSRIGIVEDQLNKWPVQITAEKLSDKEIRVNLQATKPGSTFRNAYMNVTLREGGFSVVCSKEINFKYLESRDYLGFIKKGIEQLAASGSLVVGVI